MKFLLFILVVSIFFPAYALEQSDIQELQLLADRLKTKGVEHVQIVYDWGDGQSDTVEIQDLSSNIKHFYEKEGTYAVKTAVYFIRNNQKYFKDIETRTVEYHPEQLVCDVDFSVPETTRQYADTPLTAQLKLKNEKEIKNLKFQWFIDEENNQYEEGGSTFHVFRIPTCPEKPYFTVSLRVIFRYKEGPIWFPCEIKKEARVKVERTAKIEILEYSSFLLTANRQITTPFFITLKDSAYYNSGDYYRKTNIFYKPVVFLGRQSYTADLVSVKKDSRDGMFFNSLVYLADFENAVYSVTELNNKKYIEVTVKISDPQGLVQQTVFVELVEKGE